MPAPKNFHSFPQPARQISERNRLESGDPDQGMLSRFWRPRIGAMLETVLATCARYSLRLIDRTNGKAYSADELKAQIIEDIGLINNQPLDPFDPFTIYRFPGPDPNFSTQLVMEGITNGSQCNISVFAGGLYSELWINQDGNLVGPDITSIGNNLFPRSHPLYFQIRIGYATDLDNSAVSFSNGSIPALISPVSGFGFGVVDFVNITDAYIKAWASSYVIIYSCDAVTVDVSAGSLVQIDECDNLSEIVWRGGDLLIANCSSIQSIEQGNLIPGLEVYNCLSFTQNVTGGVSELFYREFDNTGLTTYNAVGKYSGLHFTSNNFLESIDLSQVTRCENLDSYYSAMGPEAYDAMFASITNVSAFAGGSITLGPGVVSPEEQGFGPLWTSASDAKIAALNAVGCTVVTNP